MNTKTIANRDYFLRMLEDYKGAYEDRIKILTNQNKTDKNNVRSCFKVIIGQLEKILEENSLMQAEIDEKQNMVSKFEK